MLHRGNTVTVCSPTMDVIKLCAIAWQSTVITSQDQSAGLNIPSCDACCSCACTAIFCITCPCPLSLLSSFACRFIRLHVFNADWMFQTQGSNSYAYLLLLVCHRQQHSTAQPKQLHMFTAVRGSHLTQHSNSCSCALLFVCCRWQHSTQQRVLMQQLYGPMLTGLQKQGSHPAPNA